MTLSSRRRLALTAGAGVGMALLAGGAVLLFVARPLPDLLPPPREPLAPDLAIELAELRVATGVQSGRQYLYFTTTIGNIGEGPLEIRAHRRNRWTGEWRVSQQLEEQGGTRSERVTPGTIVWGGHGHGHWHLRSGAAYRIEKRSASGSETQRRLNKAGYCFFDQVPRMVRSEAARFGKDSCDGVDRTAITMGMSAGWSDPYQWTLPDQRMDITGLRDGEYRLYASADPDGWILETNERNNVDWVDFVVDTTSEPARVRVIARAPRTLPPLQVR